MNNEEKPLVTWKEIAGYLKINEKLAKKLLKNYIHYLGRRVIIYPSDIKKLINNGKLRLN
jgi:hypothetical protein